MLEDIAGLRNVSMPSEATTVDHDIKKVRAMSRLLGMALSLREDGFRKEGAKVRADGSWWHVIVDVNITSI